MVVKRIGHATIVVECGDVRCVMDPVLEEVFESGANAFAPAIRVEREALAGRFNLIVLSHEHMDHFCIETLARFDREIPVVFPKGAILMAGALTVLGFKDIRWLAAGESITIEGLTLTATASDVSFPEMGVLFQGDGHSFWNAVDSNAGERAVSTIKTMASSGVDVALVPFQPLIERPLAVDALGSDFPIERYGALIRAALDVSPACIVPGSCGFRYAINDWQNYRGFPVTESEFLEDIARVAPHIELRSLPHGGSIEVGGDFAVTACAIPYVTLLKETSREPTAWRPDLGVPPLQDRNPFRYDATDMMAEVISFLDSSLIEAMGAPELAAWTARMTTLGVNWLLEVVFPGDGLLRRLLAFDAAGPRWRDLSERWKMLTAVPASTLVALIRGEANSYYGNLSRRVAIRMYEPHRWGVVRSGSLNDEPLGKILFPTADRRFVEHELTRLGYAPSASSATTRATVNPTDERGPAIEAASVSAGGVS